MALNFCLQRHLLNVYFYMLCDLSDLSSRIDSVSTRCLMRNTRSEIQSWIVLSLNVDHNMQRIFCKFRLPQTAKKTRKRIEELKVIYWLINLIRT